MATEIASKTDLYRTYIRQLFVERSAPSSNASKHPENETQVVIDIEHDHYQIVNVGWYPNGNRNYGCILHLDIKNDKIWIQHDGMKKGLPS